MAAAQPFLSGAISKTVNMPSTTTVEDVAEAYTWGWRLGLKALAIYRDGSKQSQPLSTATEGDKAEKNRSPSREGSGFPTRGNRLPINSVSMDMRATLTSVFMKMDDPGKFSSRWPKREAPSVDLWTPSELPSR